MRLIDADRLMQNLRNNVLIDVTPELENEIMQQPTAFNRRRVIDGLERLKLHYFLNIANTGDEKLDCAYKHVSNVLNAVYEIIQKGGIE